LFLLYAPCLGLFVERILLRLYRVGVVVVLLRCAPSANVFILLFGWLALSGDFVI
jgi:hypothetical protein